MTGKNQKVLFMIAQVVRLQILLAASKRSHTFPQPHWAATDHASESHVPILNNITAHAAQSPSWLQTRPHGIKTTTILTENNTTLIRQEVQRHHHKKMFFVFDPHLNCSTETRPRRGEKKGARGGEVGGRGGGRGQEEGACITSSSL